MSLPEVLLWQAIRRKALCDLRFRRQAPMGPFILDFYCEEVRLAVEIDGCGHNMGDQPQRDERKDAWLAERGVRVLRLPAELVLKDMDSALGTIVAWVSGEAG
jgi:very-short-patch-repair endonuclease